MEQVGKRIKLMLILADAHLLSSNHGRAYVRQSVDAARTSEKVAGTKYKGYRVRKNEKAHLRRAEKKKVGGREMSW